MDWRMRMDKAVEAAIKSFQQVGLHLNRSDVRLAMAAAYEAEVKLRRKKSAQYVEHARDECDAAINRYLDRRAAELRGGE